MVFLDGCGDFAVFPKIVALFRTPVAKNNFYLLYFNHCIQNLHPIIFRNLFRSVYALMKPAVDKMGKKNYSF